MRPRPTIIFGKTKPDQKGTGKSFLANNFMMLYNNPFYINGRREYDPFYFDGLDSTNDVIYVDDVSKDNFKSISSLLFKPTIVVKRLGGWPFEIDTPKIVITLDVDYGFIKSLDPQTYKGCSFIQCSIERVEGSTLFITDKICL
ncbi:hypothetical protein [Aquimarina algiphila]|uniref:ATP-binding protein n=1 Tax=Aquimarina algiphila TaxID=2047982 RepID=A0A554VE35_9FLAO|nr:hypothetical protein [Aquimarina algiphila]TSE05225.1 hypothetical protein FOF46_23465 [Aquimarina algiphila]